MVTLERAFNNVDNVVAEAPMSRKQHLILIESIKVIKEAAYPLQKIVEPEGEEDGGTNGSTDD